mmetsp:Transcript_31700/g.80657  ORF Transcript_31700/g.80657 Transcript_31700/m.80657 type:complete len:218 (-) Transcript_31700:971-1624(-)
MSPIQMLQQENPSSENASTLYIAEAAYLNRPRDQGMPTIDKIKKAKPNASIVVLSSDAAEYLFPKGSLRTKDAIPSQEFTSRRTEVKNVHKVFLFCDLNKDINDVYAKHGVAVCGTPWMWTASEFLISSIRAHIRSRGVRDAWAWHPSRPQAAQRAEKLPTLPAKRVDVIGLMSMHVHRQGTLRYMQQTYKYKVITGGRHSQGVIFLLTRLCSFFAR